MTKIDFSTHITESSRNSDTEWEVRFGVNNKDYISKFSPINITTFRNIYEALKKHSNVVDEDKTEQLDISFNRKELPNVRVSFMNRSDIIQFCRNKKLVLSKAIVTYKKGVESAKPILVKDLSLRSNIKTEVDLLKQKKSLFSKERGEVYSYLGKQLGNLFSVPKSFRYKERFSYVMNNGFRFDLTLVKTNEPEYIYDHKKGILIPKSRYFDSFKSSDLLNCPVHYEVEMEYLNFTKGFHLQYYIDGVNIKDSDKKLYEFIFENSIHQILDIPSSQVDVQCSSQNNKLNIDISVFCYDKSSYDKVEAIIQNKDEGFNDTLQNHLLKYIIQSEELSYDEQKSTFGDNASGALQFVLKKPSLLSVQELSSILQSPMEEIFSNLFMREKDSMSISFESHNNDVIIHLTLKEIENVSSSAKDIYNQFKNIQEENITLVLNDMIKSLDKYVITKTNLMYDSSTVLSDRENQKKIAENCEQNINIILGIQQGSPSYLPIVDNKSNENIISKYKQLILDINNQKISTHQPILEYIEKKFNNVNVDETELDKNSIWSYFEQLDTLLFNNISIEEKRKQNIPYNLWKHDIKTVTDQKYLNRYLKTPRDKTKPKLFQIYTQNLEKFIGPKPITLERDNIQTETDHTTILKHFTVTDKADGLANILFIDELGDFYLIDTNLRVINIELNHKELANTILNGELITEVFDGVQIIDNTYKFVAYDIYIYKGEDVSYRILSHDTITDGTYRSNAKLIPKYETRIKDSSLSEDKRDKARSEMERMRNENDVYTFLKETPTRLNLLQYVKTVVDNKMIDVKTFYHCDESETIFNKSKQCWNSRPGVIKLGSNSNDYKYDGLIYTPRYLPVMYDYKNPFYNLFVSSTWGFNFKWKPENENSIDFLVEYKKEDVGFNSKKEKVFEFHDTNEDGDIDSIKYKSLSLYNGKNLPIKKTNSCYNLYSTKKDYFVMYSKSLFSPNQPYFPDVNLAHIPLNSKLKAITEDNQVIEDGSIVEFYFDRNEKNSKFRWKPMRIRFDKTYSYQKSQENKKYIYKCLEGFTNKTHRGELSAGFTKEYPWTHLNIPRRVDKYTSPQDEFLYKVQQYSKSKGNVYQTLQSLRESFHTVFPSWEYIPFRTEYGNNFMTANNVWKTTFNPITEEMITTGNHVNEVQEDVIYYNRSGPSYSRKQSLTINLQRFHNFIKKNILLQFFNHYFNSNERKVNLLDLACGRGGDLYKWKQSNISLIVGVDLVYDNIYNSEDGACKRYQLMLQESGQDNNLMDPKFNYKKNPRVFFFNADSGQSIEEQLFHHSNKLEKDTYNKLWNVKGTSQFSPHLELEKFNIISVQFALHYFFESKSKLDGFIQNVKKNIRLGGILIGCCYDGNNILNEFNQINGKVLEGFQDDEKIWKITKQYDNDLNEFNNSIMDLGQKIGVYMYSINAEHTEYLVNFDLFTKYLEEYDIVPLEPEDFQNDPILEKYYNFNNGTIPFRDLYNLVDEPSIPKSKLINKKTHQYIQSISNKMSESEKSVSFLNSAFIYKKR